MKNEIIKEIKKEFFPFKDDISFEESLLKNFKSYETRERFEDSNGFFYLLSTYGQKIIFAVEKEMLFIFIKNKTELVVLLVSDYNGFHNKIDLDSLLTRSVTKVDIVASDNWIKKNKEVIRITSFISENSSHLGKEYLIKGEDKIKDFNLDLIKSPLLWFLLRKDLKKRYSSRDSSYTKEKFVDGIVRVVINSLHKNNSIFKKDMTKIKNEFYSNIVNNLLDPSRKFFIEDLKSRNNIIFEQALLPSLFSSLKYDKKEFNDYINAELIPYMKEDLKDFIYEEINSLEYNKKFIDKILKDIHISSNKKLYGKEIKTIILKDDRKYYRAVLEELILFVEEEFSKEILNNNYEKREKEKKEIPFAELLYKEILRENFTDEEKVIEIDINEDEIPF